ATPDKAVPFRHRDQALTTISHAGLLYYGLGLKILWALGFGTWAFPSLYALLFALRPECGTLPAGFYAVLVRTKAPQWINVHETDSCPARSLPRAAVLRARG